VGQSDFPIQSLTQAFPNKIISLSTHYLSQVKRSQRVPHLDYLGVEPIFNTHSKQHIDTLIGVVSMKITLMLYATHKQVALPVFL
jgi:thiamine-phosphate pyrophosphorylase